ncbi:MAG TPA: PoNe immunity protein domain-containing protein [Cyclobacteriaceae bacterium]
MIRDQIRDDHYFEQYISRQIEGINKFLNWIEIGKTPQERINIVKQEIAKDYIYIILAKYSTGYSLENLLPDWKEGVKVIHESWDGFWKLKHGNPSIEYDQYILSAYDEMLWMLSLGYLLNVPDEDFKKLVEVIDRDKVKDKLYEFIISAKLKDRHPILEESYCDFFGVPETFSKLREAIQEPDKTKASKLIYDFLKKDWYKNHRDAGWYDSHKSKHDTYFGYWSFESAAVVKIMGLDDNSFKDNQYYPKAFSY